MRSVIVLGASRPEPTAKGASKSQDLVGGFLRQANSKEEALGSAQGLDPGCRLALVNPEPGEQKG